MTVCLQTRPYRQRNSTYRYCHVTHNFLLALHSDYHINIQMLLVLLCCQKLSCLITSELKFVKLKVLP